MRNIRIAAVQFEHKNADTKFNLGRIRELTQQAVDDGAEVVSFHECCVSGYTFVQEFSKQQCWIWRKKFPLAPAFRH